MRVKYVCTNCSKALLGEQGTILRSALQHDMAHRWLGAGSVIIVLGPHHLDPSGMGTAAAGGR